MSIEPLVVVAAVVKIYCRAVGAAHALVGCGERERLAIAIKAGSATRSSSCRRRVPECGNIGADFGMRRAFSIATTSRARARFDGLGLPDAACDGAGHADAGAQPLKRLSRGIV